MAASVRVTGQVLGVDIREGISKDGRPYRIATATVLVGLGVAECTLAAGMAEPARGASVDWAATVDAGGFGGFRVRVTGDFAPAPDMELTGAGSHSVQDF